MSLTEEKDALRRTVLARRDAITPDYREGKNILIGAQLVRKIDWDDLVQKKEMQAWATAEEGAKAPQITVAVYSAMRSEPDVTGFAAMAYMHNARVCYPCMEQLTEDDGSGRTQHMVLRAVTFEQREECPFVAHPIRTFASDDPVLADYPVVDAADLDVVVVPLVAFDSANNRLGYGGGNYDRLLAKTRKDALVVGIAYEEQRVDAVPCEEFDRPLQSIISA